MPFQLLKARKRFGAAAAAAACLGLLTSCFALEGAYDGSLEIRGTTDGFEIAVCRDIDVDHLFIQRSGTKADLVLANMAWSHSASAGDILTSTAGRPNSLPLSGDSMDLEPGGWLVVELTSDSVEHPAAAESDFDLPLEGLQRNQWLRQDGSTNDLACAE